MPDRFDVFLSHNSRDKPAVEEIAALLRGRGLRVWLDKWELRPGFPWQEGLEEGVRSSRAVAVFVGEDGLGSWQEPEMRAFLTRSRREKVPVIPVLLPGCPESPQLSLFLEALTWVDLREGLTEDGLARLDWGITGTKAESTGTGAAAARGNGERPGLSRTKTIPRAKWSWGVGLSLLGVILTLGTWLWPRSPDPPPSPVRPPIYSVRVQVLDPQDRPVVGSTVRASTENEPRQTPDGWWEVDIPSAKVPMGGLISLWAEHAEWEGSQVNLRLGEDQNVQAVIRLKEPETWLRGQVVDESGRALPGVRVTRQGGVPGAAVTDGEGRFQLKLSVPPETRVGLLAEHAGSAPEPFFCYAGRDSCSHTLEKR